ncbi:MAG: hypothetical protein WCF27_05940 [Gaiellaceae bacterium]
MFTYPTNIFLAPDETALFSFFIHSDANVYDNNHLAYGPGFISQIGCKIQGG